MNWIVLIIAAALVYLHFKNSTDSGSSSASDAFLNQSGARVPFTTSTGQQGYLDSGGSIYDSMTGGSVIGSMSSSGPRPGESGQVDVYDDGSDP